MVEKEKEIAISKSLKISQAQQYMLLSVLGASAALGVAISLVSTFTRQISFNAKAIAEEDQAINNYSIVLRDVGICKSPKNGKTYTDEELKNCNPDSIEVDEITGSLRERILRELAANKALNSVPVRVSSNCIADKETGKTYTYKELNEIYNDAADSEALRSASQLIRSCSALRVIPDALPSSQNEEALLASLNQLFNVSDWEPEAISPTGTVFQSEVIPGLNDISVNFSIEADLATTTKILSNIERSIREFDINSAAIEWNGATGLKLQASASAYFMDEATIQDSQKTVSGGNS